MIEAAYGALWALVLLGGVGLAGGAVVFGVGHLVNWVIPT
jgi:hypothetical protein